MAATLNKQFPSAGIVGTFHQGVGLSIRVLSGHPNNFPENFSFLHFFQVGMIFELMVMDYIRYLAQQ